MGISKNMTGSPWHTGTLRTGEHDPRRHRTWCEHYQKEMKKNCDLKAFSHCIGATWCTFYKEVPLKEREQRKKLEKQRHGRKQGELDWELKPAPAPKPQIKKAVGPVKKKWEAEERYRRLLAECNRLKAQYEEKKKRTREG